MDLREFLKSNPNQDGKTFGLFLRQRREELGKSVRGFATELEMTAAYLSDIEKGNRHAPKNYLDKLRKALGVSEEDSILFEDMADVTRGFVCPDVNPYLGGKELARVALRKARDLDISDETWQKIIGIMDADESDDS